MEFLNPLFLWGLLSVPLPVLIHLFFRRRKTTYEFSTIQFFRPRQRFLSHRRRLREILLLLLRTLALLLLTLALARPIFRDAPYSLNARTDLVLVLDDTLSMDRQTGSGERAFVVARQRAAELLETLHTGDGAALVLVSGRPGLALNRNRQEVLRALRGLKCSGAGGSYTNALRQAERLLASSSSPNREVYVLTDCQQAQLPTAPLTPEGKRHRTFLLPLNGVTENVGVSGGRLSTRPKIVNQPFRIPYELRNYGQKERAVEVALEVNGEQVQKQFLALPAGASRKDEFEYVPVAAGFLHGAVSVTDPDLLLDNRAWFCAGVAAKVQVLLVRTDIYARFDPYTYLQFAVDPPGGGALNGFALEGVFVQELTAAALKNAQVVVLADPDPLPPAAAALLRDHLRQGGTVISFAGGKVTPATFKALGLDWLTKLYGERESANASGLQFAGHLAGLNELLQFDKLRWRGLQRLTPPADSQPLALVESRPVIVEARVGDGRWLATAFSARRDYSNWPELKSFPIAMIHLFDYAANEVRRDLALECGRTVRVPAARAQVTVADLEGQVELVAARDGEAVVSETWTPGVLKLDGAELRSLALNPPPEESQLAVAAASDTANRLTRGDVHVLNPGADLAYQVQSFREGSDLAGLFLVLLALALVAESLLGWGYVLSGRATGAGDRNGANAPPAASAPPAPPSTAAPAA